MSAFCSTCVAGRVTDKERLLGRRLIAGIAGSTVRHPGPWGVWWTHDLSDLDRSSEAGSDSPAPEFSAVNH